MFLSFTLVPSDARAVKHILLGADDCCVAASWHAADLKGRVIRWRHGRYAPYALEQGLFCGGGRASLLWLSRQAHCQHSLQELNSWIAPRILLNLAVTTPKSHLKCWRSLGSSECVIIGWGSDTLGLLIRAGSDGCGGFCHDTSSNFYAVDPLHSVKRFMSSTSVVPRHNPLYVFVSQAIQEHHLHDDIREVSGACWHATLPCSCEFIFTLALPRRLATNGRTCSPGSWWVCSSAAWQTRGQPQPPQGTWWLLWPPPHPWMRWRGHHVRALTQCLANSIRAGGRWPGPIGCPCLCETCPTSKRRPIRLHWCLALQWVGRSWEVSVGLLVGLLVMQL